MADDKKALIVGFTQRTSFSLAKILLELGYSLAISDVVRNTEKEALLKELTLIGKVENYLGEQSIDLLDRFQPDLILPSPGVPLTIPLLMEAKRRGLPVIGDIELFYRFFPNHTYIAITGTDGKTTTTALVYEILRQEKKALIGGNIGRPIFDLYHRMEPETLIVLEISSFQLEAISSFHPHIAAVLNIAQDHLDRYPSMEHYLLAKKNIFKNMTFENTAVLNLDSPYYSQIRKGVSASQKTFSRQNPHADIIYNGRAIYYRGKEFIPKEDIGMVGIHNIENVMAAVLIADLVGIHSETIKRVVAEFKGLPHRLELVREIDGVRIYNDSKATTANSLEKALQSFEEPIILIAGGRDKGLDFRPLKNLVAQRVRKLVLIGEAAGKIKKQFQREDAYLAHDMPDAVNYAISQAQSGEVVMLSPGCASFDMFENYEQRGEVFKELVRAYRK